MSERIDHAEHSQACLDISHQYLSDEEFAYADHAVKKAQVHATLALVEQQRIANLIAANKHIIEEMIPGSTTGGTWFVLLPEIAAALGVE